MLVCEGEPPSDLDGDLERLLHVQASFSHDVLLEVLAFDVLEDDELPPVLLAPVDHGDDVRVLELGDRARLALEALDEVLVGGVPLVQDLQRDVALEQRVLRLVDARHPAVSDELLDLVAFGNGLPDHGQKATRASLAACVGVARRARGRRTRCRRAG